MKLYELKHNHTHGTIAKLELSKDSRDMLSSWCAKEKISCIEPEKMHCTVLYSQHPVPYLTEFNGKSFTIEAQPVKWEVLGTALTLKVKNTQIDKLHRLMIDAGGTHDYPEFIPHVTVSYNWENKEKPKSIYDIPICFNEIKISAINPDYKKDVSKNNK